MRYFAWLLRPPRWLVGIGALAGAAVFIVATVLSFLPFEPSDASRSSVTVPVLLFVAATLVLPATRAFAAGFMVALVLATFADAKATRHWWAPMRGLVMRVTRPMRERQAREEHLAAWLAQNRGQSLRVSDALVLLSNLRGSCLGPLTRGDSGLGVPADLDGLLAYPMCEPYRTSTRREQLEWPQRYFEGDTGWRWEFERIAQPTLNAGPNFRVVLRPDSLLEHAGPVVEETGDGRIRVRERDGAPWHMVSTPVPTMRRIRECVLRAAAMADSAGDTTALFEYLADGYYARKACREISVTSSTTRDNGDRVLDIVPRSRPGQERAETGVVLFRMVGPRRFEVRGRAWGSRYLLDADGLPHVTTADRDAGVSDPAPERCEEDTSVACTNT